jgi:hypothetical protein
MRRSVLFSEIGKHPDAVYSPAALCIRVTVDKILSAILVQAARRRSSRQAAAHCLAREYVRAAEMLDDLHWVGVDGAVLPRPIIPAHAAENERETRT